MNAIIWFKSNIQRVDIENYNLCNRRCPTCPQSLGIRQTKFELFDEALYSKLLTELALCGFSKTLAIGRYHEPLLFFDITLDRIRLARRQLPCAHIILNTNGDYLNKYRLEQLSEAGLNEIKIMQYQDSEYSTSIAERLCRQMASKLDKDIVRINCVNGEIFYVQLENEDTLMVSVRSENYHSPRGNYRGGLLEDLITTVRTTPCFVPHKSIDIDYNGNVLPCCNMISDSELHKPYVIGNIKNNTIFDLYWKSTHSSFYEDITHTSFESHKVCKYCLYNF